MGTTLREKQSENPFASSPHVAQCHSGRLTSPVAFAPVNQFFFYFVFGQIGSRDAHNPKNQKTNADLINCVLLKIKTKRIALPEPAAADVGVRDHRLPVPRLPRLVGALAGAEVQGASSHRRRRSLRDGRARASLVEDHGHRHLRARRLQGSLFVFSPKKRRFFRHCPIYLIIKKTTFFLLPFHVLRFCTARTARCVFP